MGKGNPHALLVGMQMRSQYGKQYGGFSKKVKTEPPCVPATPTLGRVSKTSKTTDSKNTCPPTFIPVLFTVDQIRRKPNCPSADEWTFTHVRQDDVVAVRIYSAIPSATKSADCCRLQRHGRGWRALREINQTEKDKYCMISRACGI